MRPLATALGAVALIGGELQAQAVPDESQSAKIEAGYRRPDLVRLDPFRHVMLGHWGLVISGGASGTNSAFSLADAFAIKHLDDNNDLLLSDWFDAIGIVPRGRGLTGTALAEGGAHLGMNFGRHLSLGFSAMGRGYGSFQVSDSLVSLLRDGNVGGQAFALGQSGGAGMATAEGGIHAVVRLGPIASEDGAVLSLGAGLRYVRPIAYGRLQSRLPNGGTVQAGIDSIVATASYTKLLTPLEGSLGLADRARDGSNGSVVNDFLIRASWPTSGTAFEVMFANIGTVTVPSVERDTVTFDVATPNIRDVGDILDTLDFTTQDTVDLEVQLPRIVRFTASAWANRILQLDLSATMPIEGQFETPMVIDVGSTWRLVRHLPLRAGIVIGGHQGIGFSGGFGIESRNFLLRFSGQSLGGFMRDAKGAGGRFDFGIFF